MFHLSAPKARPLTCKARALTNGQPESEFQEVVDRLFGLRIPKLCGEPGEVSTAAVI
jgi:hypothetical protein